MCTFDWVFIKQNIFHFIRLILAFYLIFWGAIPLLRKGTELVDRDLKELIPADTTTNHEGDGVPALRVWTYGLQLVVHHDERDG